VSEVLEQWLALQRQWMYLEPIFSSPDIMQQLPLEGKRFAAVDRSWRKTLDAAKRTPNVIKVRMSGSCDSAACSYSMQ
jgi:dynein heavy chain